MQFYIKGENDEYVAAQDKVDSIVEERLAKYKTSEQKKIRQEVEDTIRTELTGTLTSELTDKIKSEFQPKIDEAVKKANQFEVQVRQKTIAAEYGFGSDLESFLGEGSDEEMKAKADILKNNRASVTVTPPAKTTTTTTSTGFVTKVD